MANKFTKSVLERQAKEAKDAKLYAHSAETSPSEPESHMTETFIPPVIDPEPKNSTIQPPPKASENTAPKKQPKTIVSGQVDLSAFIIRDNERSAKNKTFYLDAAVIDAIKTAATAQKVTDSKLVNDILKKILGVK
ncbi:MAG: hypothetical protein E7476_00560 [Ruminococcaceae bacterium]|nr:hypothetical protein [Oscillospiraceae bacterium]